MDELRIATRQSALALWQAEHVKGLIEARWPGTHVTLVGLTTEGDRRLDVALSAVGGKGLFIKELEVALLDGRADIAVHSMKDVPAMLADEFVVTTVGERADPRDALVAGDANFHTLPEGAKVGSSSLRRRCQLLHLRPDLDITPVRGNVGTRLDKLDAGEFSALVLAAAALDRLDLGVRVSERLAPATCVPAAGQGVLAVEYRAGDDAVRDLVAAVTVEAVERRVVAERALARTLGGDCTMPLGSHAVLDGDAIELAAVLGASDGSRLLKVTVRGDDPAATGEKAARQLEDLGARELIGAE